MKMSVRHKFNRVFGETGDIRSFFSPGRVNLIGEHTDYNGGYVFPCALTMGTYGVVRKREDDLIRVFSGNYEKDGIQTFLYQDLIPSQNGKWTDYIKGVIWAFGQKGYKINAGLDILIYGTLPNGAGLSSSASLEVLIGLMLIDLFGFDVSMVDLAVIARYAENEFVGCKCGIMDQFACAMGKTGYGIFLNTTTLKYSYAPVTLQDSQIVITNSKVKHSLVGSAYNTRLEECEIALKDLQRELNIKNLAELTVEDYIENRHLLSSEIGQKRVRHVVMENHRTIQAQKVLAHGDIKTFGRLMNQSHISLRDDYEVSCKEIDILVELAQSMEGVIGSRLTGGGFGGCTVSIVKNQVVDDFIEYVGTRYEERVGYKPEFYVVNSGNGAGVLA